MTESQLASLLPGACVVVHLPDQGLDLPGVVVGVNGDSVDVALRCTIPVDYDLVDVVQRLPEAQTPAASGKT